MDKILEMLGIDKLDESKQAEVKQKFDDIVQVKVDEKVKTKEDELRESLTEEYETKFDDYKNQITEQFSNFVDEVIDEEFQIPEKIKEYARKGELYEDVMETLKTRMAIDEGAVSEETKELLRECKNEITSLKKQVNEMTSENMKVKKDAKEFASALYLREKCEGLSFKQKEAVLGILEGVTDKEEIDRKFDVIVESVEEDDNKKVDEEVKGKGQEEPETKANEEVEADPMKRMVSFWAKNLNESRL